MEEAPENGKESSNSAHANGMNEYIMKSLCKWQSLLKNQTKIQYNKELPTALFV